MKHNFFSITLIGLSLLLVHSCSFRSPESTSDEDSLNSSLTEDSTLMDNDSSQWEEESEVKITSLLDIIPLIPEVEVPVSYTDNNMESGIENAVKRNCWLLDSRIMPDSVFCDHEAAFTWKKVFPDFILIDVSTTFISAKGQCIIHHLFTVDNQGNVIDIKLDWAGHYAIAIDNDFGGTSAGEEWKSGLIELGPVIRVC